MTYMPVLDTKLNVWTLAAVLTALYTLAGILKGWWRASLGKRRTIIKGYRRLAPFVRHEYVKALFGEPAWAHKQTAGMHDVDEQQRPVQKHIELTVRTTTSRAPFPSAHPSLGALGCSSLDGAVCASPPLATGKRWVSSEGL
ncbi:hypothetical protein [Streptomyces sp. NEAU-174]|uniref:hypothetical protein n=1 Tax=Streptomyces sp. NEAU-174 TaxID=3458254 RepID=UPI0040447E68